MTVFRSRFFTLAPAVSLLLSTLLLQGCASQPAVPDWQLSAKSASDRFVSAYLTGNSRVEALEFEKSRQALSSTGRPEALARLELLRCATRVASLVLEPCAGFDLLRADASAADLAYADYLAGRATAQNVALLPAAQQRLASAAPTAQGSVMQAMDEPLSRLVGAGVLMRTGQASPAALAQAVETASAQGWRRPLLAWLGVQVLRAEQAGDMDEAKRLRRRMDVAAP
jgi:hypothetical protein